MSADAQSHTRRRVIVHGRVQGVFFRGSTQEEAERAGTHGWVRNRSDGTVEAVFEGSAEAVEALVRFCHTGPSWARVEAVEVFEEPQEGLSSFRVR
jgi:acylphosphatase